MIVLLLSLSALAAGAAAAAYPLTLQDDAGRTVTLPAEPVRVVSLVPSLTETVCAIGACDRLIGVDDYSNYPEHVRALPKLGSLYNPVPERIVALKPDLVVLSKYDSVLQVLAQAGLTVFVMRSETFDDIFRNLETLGVLLNEQAQARQVAESLQREMERLEELAHSDPERPAVYYEIDPTPYSAGPDSFIGVMISKAGGRNVVPARLGLFPRISPELVIASDPDVIILGDAPYGETPARVAERPGWAGLAAVKSGRVVALNAAQVDVLNRPGPRSVEALRLLVEILHPALRDELERP
ncbi:MAG: ABC transporter substrate-binding protein [Bacillota bacterium]